MDIKGIATDHSLSDESVQNIGEQISQRHREDRVNENFSHLIQPLLKQIQVQEKVVSSFKKGVDLLLQQALDAELDRYDQRTFINDVADILDYCDESQKDQVKQFCLGIAIDEEQKAYINSLIQEAEYYISKEAKKEAEKMIDNLDKEDDDEYIDEDGNILNEEQHKRQLDRLDKEYRKKMNKTV